MNTPNTWACIVAAAEAHGVTTDDIASGPNGDVLVTTARRAAWSVAMDIVPSLTHADLARDTNVNRKTVHEGISIIRRRAEWCHATAAVLASIEVRALELGSIDRTVIVARVERGDQKTAATDKVVLVEPSVAKSACALRRKGWSLKGIARHLGIDALSVARIVGEDPSILGGR